MNKATSEEILRDMASAYLGVVTHERVEEIRHSLSSFVAGVPDCPCSTCQMRDLLSAYDQVREAEKAALKALEPFADREDMPHHLVGSDRAPTPDTHLDALVQILLGMVRDGVRGVDIDSGITFDLPQSMALAIGKAFGKWGSTAEMRDTIANLVSKEDDKAYFHKDEWRTRQRLRATLAGDIRALPLPSTQQTAQGLDGDANEAGLSKYRSTPLAVEKK